ncbi:hypothetical protein CB1_000087013 [Camelus ferus]|nr:hypothetical protein CB1_000087013 [Camelus ferus]
MNVPLFSWNKEGLVLCMHLVGLQLEDFLVLLSTEGPMYVGSLDVPRPNSRVEIVAAMRRIRRLALWHCVRVTANGQLLLLRLLSLERCVTTLWG